MRPEDIILTPKIKYIMNTPGRYLLVEGPSGSGKTFGVGLRTFFKIFNSPAGHDQYAFVAESISTAEKMLIDDSSSFYNIFNSVCTYRGGRKPHIKIQGRYGEKTIYLGGYSTKRDWTKILGLNLFGLHIEEMSEAHEDFVREAFVRASRLEQEVWINATTNGAYPESIFYTEFFDRSYVNMEHNKNIPQITLDYMNQTTEKDKDFEYIFFGGADSPTQTPETLARLERAFPVGSFFYMSKFIGARGFAEGAIYAEYMDDQKHFIPYKEAMDARKNNYVKFTIGVDVGINDHTVFTLIGFTPGFQKMVILDYFKINNVGADAIWSKFVQWYDPYYNNPDVHNKMHGMFIDAAGGGLVLRKTIEGKLLYKYNMQAASAHKKRIVDRIEGNTKFFYADRIIFTEKTKDIYDAFRSATYTKDKTKTDPRVFGKHINKDLVDATEYGQSPFFEHMLRN